ncbi:MAG TPA: hypothetical protein VHE13_04990 [Opitutus sp.]|nr:hypothetical protein [Opitutus sp.]
MKRVRIHRHPDCARCARIARLHQALDWLNRIAVSTEPPPGDALPRGHIAVIDLGTGARIRGAAGFGLICRNVPAYWPLLALLHVPSFRRRVEREIDPGLSRGRPRELPGVHSAS